LLCCPVDQGYPLRLENGEYRDGEIISGLLRCPTCDTDYTIVAGIPYLTLPGAAQESAAAAAKGREAAARDADADEYDTNVSPYHTAVERAALLNALAVRAGDVVVDLGAGTGRLTIELARRDAIVLALDLSPRSLEINRRKCAAVPGSKVHHVVCDACYLPLRDGVAAKAVSGMMLEHLPGNAERRRCLAEVYRVLRPGGRLALTVYNYCLSKRRSRDREGFHGAALYYYRFDATEFRRLLNQYRVRQVTGLLNLPRGIHSRRLDQIVAALPPIAQLRGILLFGVAER
jgi:ubiquinone/menaquinone biosynthesis C-methylase UbiE/uncharacterized protein YbaR (Trm112 family)